jgi:peptidoglycan hydrolase CwlO-like protein
MKLGPEQSVQMPMKTVASLIVLVSIFTFSYFQITEKINKLETANHLIKKDLEGAVEFSIKWPRGELGTLPADSEQFLLIEDAIKDIEDIQEEIKESRHNAVNISRLQKDVDKILEEIEKLKDKVRNNGNSH